MILSTDAEKVFDKIHLPSSLKKHNEGHIQQTYSKHCMY
jgi:hypothetical protein